VLTFASRNHPLARHIGKIEYVVRRNLIGYFDSGWREDGLFRNRIFPFGIPNTGGTQMFQYDQSGWFPL
jgi:hypothetical protein